MSETRRTTRIGDSFVGENFDVEIEHFFLPNYRPPPARIFGSRKLNAMSRTPIRFKTILRAIANSIENFFMREKHWRFLWREVVNCLGVRARKWRIAYLYRFTLYPSRSSLRNELISPRTKPPIWRCRLEQYDHIINTRANLRAKNSADNLRLVFFFVRELAKSS